MNNNSARLYSRLPPYEVRLDKQSENAVPHSLAIRCIVALAIGNRRTQDTQILP
ncbi:hypothetical protein [Microseira sp. BLCC-F43]|jgi:hypothetical protein|uniref:hypothetical protein n=1 Tax=Microseira sp. BLCC-F43 TaxID=3153602 RepID=UPI0035B6E285